MLSFLVSLFLQSRTHWTTWESLVRLALPETLSGGCFGGCPGGCSGGCFGKPPVSFSLVGYYLMAILLLVFHNYSLSPSIHQTAIPSERWTNRVNVKFSFRIFLFIFFFLFVLLHCLFFCTNIVSPRMQKKWSDIIILPNPGLW